MKMSEIVSLLMTQLIIAYFLLIVIFQKSSHAQNIQTNHNQCPPSSCGNLHNISFPFRLRTDPQHCGDKNYELSCENNYTVLTIRELQKLYVKEINYNKYTIRVVDPDFRKENCSSIPKHSLSKYSFSGGERIFETEIGYRLAGQVGCNDFTVMKRVRRLTEAAIFLTCENKPTKNSHLFHYIDRSPCIINGDNSSSPRYYSYVVLDGRLSFSDLEESCRIEKVTQISSRDGFKNLNKKGSSYVDVYGHFLDGFELSWLQAFSNPPGQSYCFIRLLSNKVHCQSYYCEDFGSTFNTFFITFFELEAMLRLTLLIPIIVIAIDKWRKRHQSLHKGIEEFLQSHNNSMPIKYLDWEITKMTNGFKEKLGEGGFGSVYKGKLSNGRLVAVKMLGKSKANGQDFVNEVSTIGRVHHVNVVQLVGFFIKGSNRALIYEYLSNGSLDNHIFSREGEDKKDSLSRKELLRISSGVARGIEYLHRGCDTRILHFDIKPHNILLDDNFVPKVSDFGLARICPQDDSIVSLTAARGTIGYIAPELFYKNIGGVSHKADVYSFGMLLMEMASRRKNVNAHAQNSSQIYFPLWIYDQFSKGVEIIEDATEEESEIVKKMIVVALWCIQLKPSDRPTMSKVIEMLEGEFESLRTPPKPCLYPQEQEIIEKYSGNDGTEYSSSSSMPLEEGSGEISLISNAY